MKLAALAATYNDLAPYYQALTEPNRPQRVVWLKQAANVLQAKSARVLDVGCGIGDMADVALECFPDKATRYVGIDIADQLVAAAQKAHADDRCEFKVADAKEFAEVEGPMFDLVLLQAVIHLYNCSEAIALLTHLLANHTGKMCMLSTRVFPTYREGNFAKNGTNQSRWRIEHTEASLLDLVEKTLALLSSPMGFSFDIFRAVDLAGNPWLNVMLYNREIVRYHTRGFSPSLHVVPPASMLKECLDWVERAESVPLTEQFPSAVRYVTREPESGKVWVHRYEGFLGADLPNTMLFLHSPMLQHLVKRLLNRRHFGLFKIKLNMGEEFPPHQDHAAMWPDAPIVTLGIPLCTPKFGGGTLLVCPGYHRQGLFGRPGEEMDCNLLPDSAVWRRYHLNENTIYAIDSYVPHRVLANTMRAKRPIMFLTFIGRKSDSLFAEHDAYMHAKCLRQPPFDLARGQISLVLDRFGKMVIPEQVQAQFGHAFNYTAYKESTAPIDFAGISPSPPKCDLVVVGAGPAGLACAHAAAKNGLGNILVIDGGKLLESRDANHAVDAANGIGGAGLFSDGKFSFGMAGSAVHQTNNFETATAQVAALVESVGITVPRASDMSSTSPYADLKYKPYPTVYGSLQQRTALIRALLRAPGVSVMPNTRVVAVRPIYGGGMWSVQLSQFRSVFTHRVVLACGRYGPTFKLGDESEFRRVEFGVRLEAPVGSPVIPSAGNALDPKLTFMLNKDVEVRTFCVCRNAEATICTNIQASFPAYSGRKTETPTGRSNLGLMVRVTNARSPVATGALSSPAFVGGASMPPIKLRDTDQLTKGLAAIYGNVAGDTVFKAIHAYLEHIGQAAADNVTVLGPCLEGFGYYPDVAIQTGATRRPGLYVVGDHSGLYRGLVPAMIGGWACGLGL